MTATAIAQPESEVPTALVRCLSCEYDLRGQPRATGHCPECGMAVEPSWQRHAADLPPLRLSSTTWLRAMALGCCLIILAAILNSIEAVSVIRTNRGDDGFKMLAVVTGLSELAAVSVGLWLLGAREPLAPATRRAGAGGGRAARFAVRIAAVILLVLPFAAIAISVRFTRIERLDGNLAILSTALAWVTTWVAMRRFAAGARRAARRRLARWMTVFAWAAPMVWIAHAVTNRSIPYAERAEWLLHPHPLVGFIEAVVVLPGALIQAPRWSGGMTPLLPWIPEAVISLIGVVLLAAAARMFFVAAAQSPRPAARDA